MVLPSNQSDAKEIKKKCSRFFFEEALTRPLKCLAGDEMTRVLRELMFLNAFDDIILYFQVFIKSQSLNQRWRYSQCSKNCHLFQFLLYTEFVKEIERSSNVNMLTKNVHLHVLGYRFQINVCLEENRSLYKETGTGPFNPIEPIVILNSFSSNHIIRPDHPILDTGRPI